MSITCPCCGHQFVPYTADSIRVLPEDDVVERFDWAKVGALAAQYNRDEGWIRRGLSACEAAGVAPRYFIQRYLDGDKTVPRHEGVEAAFMEALFADRAARQVIHA